MPRGELIAFASTPAGQEALGRMLRSLASPKPPLMDRVTGLLRRHSPDTIDLPEGSEGDAQLMNALQVLETLPPELKQPHIEVFVQMLDHPLHGALAVEEIQKLGPRATNALPLLLARFENGSFDAGAMELAASLAPGDPRIFAVLANVITNPPASPGLSFDRYRAVGQLAELFPTNSGTLKLMQIAAQDADPMVATAAQSHLSAIGARVKTREIPPK